MFRTNRMPKDTENIYFLLLIRFGEPYASKIMKFLVSSRTYNIQLVGSTGVGKSCFAQRLLRNTFTPNYISGAIAFPTPLGGKAVFNIRECGYRIIEPTLNRLVRDEWNKTDAFFVMFSHEATDPSRQCEAWIQNIRRIVGVVVPIVIVGLKCDVPNYNLKPNIQILCSKYCIPYVELSSRDGTNIHGPFLALQDILRTDLDRNMFVDDPNIPITPLLLPPPSQDQDTSLFKLVKRI